MPRRDGAKGQYQQPGRKGGSQRRRGGRRKR